MIGDWRRVVRDVCECNLERLDSFFEIRELFHFGCASERASERECVRVVVRALPVCIYARTRVCGWVRVCVCVCVRACMYLCLSLYGCVSLCPS